VSVHKVDLLGGDVEYFGVNTSAGNMVNGKFYEIALEWFHY